MKIAIWQTPGHAGDPAANLAALEQTAAQAARDGVDLLVLPELWLSGYNLGTAIHDLAQPADGPASAQVARVAEQYGLGVIYGYPERAGKQVFNSARFIDAHGNALANMHKGHLYGADENALFATDDSGFPVVEYQGLKIGMAICYDIEFPEVARSLALRGADLIAVPTALFAPYDFVATHVVPVRAWESQLFVAYANRCGEEGTMPYVGRSCICAPDGHILADTGEDAAIITANIDPAHYNQASTLHNTYLADRRIELYAPLAANR